MREVVCSIAEVGSENILACEKSIEKTQVWNTLMEVPQLSASKEKHEKYYDIQCNSILIPNLT